MDMVRPLQATGPPLGGPNEPASEAPMTPEEQMMAAKRAWWRVTWAMVAVFVAIIVGVAVFGK